VFSASSKGKSPVYSKTWDWNFGVARAFSVVISSRLGVGISELPELQRDISKSR